MSKLNNLPFYLHVLLPKADLLLRSQSMNDSEGDKLRRRKLSFDSEGETGNSFYL